ncbi:MAG: NAD(P)-dependent oxidoreductase [Rhodospirillales bacterium]|nr:NAD(P)-dependent oxidoreductase [Rhodospirillales bacterium]
MARHILEAGHELIVSDARKESCDDLVAKGAQFLPTVGETVAQCEAVILCVPYPGPQEIVMNEVLANAKPGLLIIDTTVMPPTINEELEQTCKSQGLEYIDAPVGGGGWGASEGTLGVMVGGEEASYQRALPVLETFAAKVRLLGPIGYGNKFKLMTECIFLAYMAAFSEGLVVGEQMGFSVETMLDMFENTSPWHSHMAHKYDEIKGESTRRGFLIHRARMFLEITRDAVDNPIYGTPVFDSMISTFKKAENLGFGDDDLIIARRDYLKLN